MGQEVHMEQQELNEEQLKAKHEEMVRGIAFEGLMHHEGFAFVKAYYENKLKAFVNDMFNQEKKPISEFENERHELMGLKKLFGEIDWAVNQLENDRKNSKSTK